MPKGTGYTTLELKVNFIKAFKIDTGEFICEGKVIHVGNRVATAEAKVIDSAGTLYAHATTTCLVVR
ncbi:MAG: PaaI family thioesterase [Trueperaceae bacterium]